MRDTEECIRAQMKARRVSDPACHYKTDKLCNLPCKLPVSVTSRSGSGIPRRAIEARTHTVTGSGKAIGDEADEVDQQDFVKIERPINGHQPDLLEGRPMCIDKCGQTRFGHVDSIQM
ncbi:hypothetical protein ANO11243_063380 [Dothideomycetidae sp. 11243]|nr:hypothetical protein ANO11243_063380 [fungal sp. No.11243]